MKQGYVHSIDTGGMVDGPGIRYVIFLAGCSLRCKYCHNPDTWKINRDKETSVQELITDIKKYRSYLKFSGGGVTITGGEPFVQSGFLIELLKACKEEGFHTVLDTAGHAPLHIAELALRHTDLILLDIKSIDHDTYKDLTGMPLDRALKFLGLSEELKIPVWIRFVLVPGYTDNFDDIQKLSDYLQPFTNVQKIEVLPFHKMGEYKWKDLDIPYELGDVEPPSKEVLERAKAILEIK